MLLNKQSQRFFSETSRSKVEQAPVSKQKQTPKTYQDIMFNTGTNKVAHTLLGFLGKSDRSALAATTYDSHLVSYVDKALTDDNFKIALMREILGVLSNPRYQEQLTVNRNPSGFLRLNNDLIKLIRHPNLLKALPEAAELRLNFWPGDLYKNLGAKLEPETAHSHPKTFASFIVTGGYNHNIHLPSNNPKDPDFMVFKGVEVDGNKTFEKQAQRHHLNHVTRERVESGSRYAYFATSIVHQVHERIPAPSLYDDHGTLSINVVFAPRKGKPIEYNIYMNDEGSLVEKYDRLDPIRARKTLSIVQRLLINKIGEFRASESGVQFRKPAEEPSTSVVSPRVSKMSDAFGPKDYLIRPSKL